MYEVEFKDGKKTALSANSIAENIFATIDEEGHRHVLMVSIIRHRKNKEAVKKDDAFATSSNGVKRKKETTKSYHINIMWKDGSTTWSKMSCLRVVGPEDPEKEGQDNI